MQEIISCKHYLKYYFYRCSWVVSLLYAFNTQNSQSVVTSSWTESLSKGRGRRDTWAQSRASLLHTVLNESNRYTVYVYPCILATHTSSQKHMENKLHLKKTEGHKVIRQR
ncbi:hypothetical protein CHARACLAT_026207 [Characodon lateralis]|uniref:Secreted protein n=1 Tax=Characodon lateralis TaxID=208331 RepID=A0ABU7EWW6_9TELE|nr:hypothetical protein [Characodon lateralis]